MNAELITIGDEILIGQVIDTNASWLGQELSKLGVSVVHRTTVPDKREAILSSLAEAKKRARLILMTGGLGPTKDDITKLTLCEYFGSTLIENKEVLHWVNQIFRYRKLPMLETNKAQALVPDNCEVLFNRNGTAPGMWFADGAHVFISMPGVPSEMKGIFETECVEKIKSKFALPVIIHRTIQTCAIGESFLARKIEAWENKLPSHIRLAYLPAVGLVRLRLSGYANDLKQLDEEMKLLISDLYKLAGEYIFGEGDITIQEVTGNLLKAKNKTISTAESCTGGYIAHLITSVPGSSAYYTGSIVSYDNKIKTAELGVKPETLIEDGAVSEKCVKEMAEGIRIRFGTDYAIATSGIAGPDGGSKEKPVGTVWIAVSSPEKTISRLFHMGDNRERTIQRTGIHALDMLRRVAGDLQ